MQKYIKAVNFESRIAYRSEKKPGYCAWASFFPGGKGLWYLSFLELEQKDHIVELFPREFYYQMGVPNGMDDSKMVHDIIIMESDDDLKDWKTISHDTTHHRAAFGDFAQAYTGNGRFIRFVWQGYSYEPGRHPGEICYISDDGGETWMKQPPFHDRRFVSYPHRLRPLKDGTLVLALPISLDFDNEKLRCCYDLNAETQITMNLCFSYDKGGSWTVPLPIYGGHNVSETDFVELDTGDLLCINCSIPFFGSPGRQIIYRTDMGFVPGAYEMAQTWESCVPETVAMNEDGILIGCMRSSRYAWSDDLGLNWHDLGGIPEEITHPDRYGKDSEIYQPWINYIGNGKFACVGHYGQDDALRKEYDNHITLHVFEVESSKKPKDVKIAIQREYDEAKTCWPNKYTVSLTCGGAPVCGEEVELWWVRNGEPGGREDEYLGPLEERIGRGGRIQKAITDMNGLAGFDLSELDSMEDKHWRENFSDYVYMSARYNHDRKNTAYKAAQSLQYMFYIKFRYEPANNI